MNARHARVALVLAAISLVGLPLSYSWILSPGSNPPWLGPVIAVAEWGGLACAIVAIWLGRRARAAGVISPAAIWAPRLGIAAILVYLATWVVLATSYRP